MAEIKLSNLNPVGSELLQDSESFLNELNEQEMEDIVGGYFFFAVDQLIVQSNIGNSINANSAFNVNTVIA